MPDTTKDARKRCTIHLRGVPRQFNAKEFLYEFYQQFGVILRVEAFPNSDTAEVTFQTPEAASKAVMLGTIFSEAQAPVVVALKSNSSFPALEESDIQVCQKFSVIFNLSTLCE